MNLNNLRPAKGATLKRTNVLVADTVLVVVVLLLVVTKVRSLALGILRKVGFEGGQMPLQRRVPKFGFKNINRVEYKAINLDAIQALVERKNVTEITLDVLRDNGLVSQETIW